ncbi:MAG TPA: serine/threonine-protein kinase [Polyangiaceae bacterium]|nr:serine/threonine-protein kinase [Polyangiaceae bacterium]
MTPALLAPGSMLGSRWILGGLLGQSEGAEVYEAEEAHQRRFAAIKFFDPAFASEPAWSEHARVTRALSELPGPGIARAYDIGMETAFKRPYVASEHITFPTLARYVAERGAVSLRGVAQMLNALATGLDAAHAAGIVHGGLKPQNVFVSPENPEWARLTDFGVSRLRAANGRGPLALLGWSAPEAQAGFLTPAGDRYALALLCYFAATGIPFYNALRTRDDAQSEKLRATRIASERAKNQGAELDPLFDDWFKRALAADPNARFGSATEMARAFVEVFGGGPTGAMPVRASAPPAPRPSAAPPHGYSETDPLSRTARAPGPESAAPETPMAATVAVPTSRQHVGDPSFLPQNPASLSRPPVSPRRLGPVVSLAGATAVVLLMLLVWWIRTR